jgi:hypothetical protein
MSGGGGGRRAHMPPSTTGPDPHVADDPLALLFHLDPEAFELDPTPVRVTRASGAGRGGDHGGEWRLERCEDEQKDGYVLEPSEVRLERYAAFLRRASALDRSI